MTTSKFDPSHPFETVRLEPGQTHLTLTENEVVVRKNGLEFLAKRALPLWEEVSVDLRTPASDRPLRGTGVVVDCTGNRHSGYTISLLLLDLSAQSQHHLQQLALASAS